VTEGLVVCRFGRGVGLCGGVGRGMFNSTGVEWGLDLCGNSGGFGWRVVVSCGVRENRSSMDDPSGPEGENEGF